MRPETNGRNMRQHSLIITFYALVAFIVLHPLIFNNGTSVAGFDYFHFHWNFWWVRHVLNTPGLDVYQSDFVFFPSVNNLSFHTLTLFWFPLWALVEPITGTLTAMNVILFVGCTLNGYVLFLWLRRCDIVLPLALMGGLVLQVTPLIRYFYYNTHINLIPWFWLPLHLILWQQIVRSVQSGKGRKAVGWALVQGTGFWLMALSDLQYLLFLAPLIIPFGLMTLWQTKNNGLIQLMGLGFLAVLIGLCLMWFVGPLSYVLDFPQNEGTGPVEDRPGIPLSGFLVADSVWWWWNVPTLGGFVTFAILGALALHFTRWRKQMKEERWLWFVTMLPPLLIALGPQIIVFGRQIHMPYRLLHAATNGQFFMPWRMAPVYLIAAITFATLSWSPIIQSLRFNRLLVVVGSLLLLLVSLRFYQGGPVIPVTEPYDFYNMLGAEPYQYVVLEVPTAAGTGLTLIGDERAITLQYHAVTHGKKLINGFVARAPLGDYYYLVDADPLLSWLGQRIPLDFDTATNRLREIINHWPVGYVVVHQDIIGHENPANQEVIGYLNQVSDLLCPVLVEHDAVVYRTTWHPDSCPHRIPAEAAPGVYRIDIGNTDDVRHLGWGWHWAEDIAGLTARWMGQGNPATIYLDLPPGRYEMTISAQSFAQPRDVTFRLNDEVIETLAISEVQLAPYAVSFQVDEESQLAISLQSAVPMERVGDRTLTVLVDWIEFRRND